MAATWRIGSLAKVRLSMLAAFAADAALAIGAVRPYYSSRAEYIRWIEEAREIHREKHFAARGVRSASGSFTGLTASEINAWLRSLPLPEFYGEAHH